MYPRKAGKRRLIQADRLLFLGVSLSKRGGFGLYILCNPKASSTQEKTRQIPVRSSIFLDTPEFYLITCIASEKWIEASKFEIASQTVAFITCIADTKIIETVKLEIASQTVALIAFIASKKMIEIANSRLQARLLPL